LEIKRTFGEFGKVVVDEGKRWNHKEEGRSAKENKEKKKMRKGSREGSPLLYGGARMIKPRKSNRAKGKSLPLEENRTAMREVWN